MYCILFRENWTGIRDAFKNAETLFLAMYYIYIHLIGLHLGNEYRDDWGACRPNSCVFIDAKNSLLVLRETGARSTG